MICRFQGPVRLLYFALGLAGILLFAGVIVQADEALKPSTVLANPEAYDNHSISVVGTVSDYKSRTTPRGKIALFQICDFGCLSVIDRSGASQNGQATVTGTFHRSMNTRRGTRSNIIVIGSK